MIFSRDEIVKKQATEAAGNVEHICDLVNKVLQEAKTLPIQIQTSVLGTPPVRDEVLKQLRNANWSVVLHCDTLGGDYYVIK